MIMELPFTSHCSVLKLPRVARLSSNHSSIHHRTVAAKSTGNGLSRNHERLQAYLTNNIKSSISMFKSNHRVNRRVIVCVKSNALSKNSPGENSDSLNISMVGGAEPFHGKSGSVSFHGLTHQMVEESKLISSPFKDINASSSLWILAPVAFISSLVLPQFLDPIIDFFFRDEILAELVTALSSEVTFYIGLAIFLFTTHKIQKPYLQFSPKRWGLITGLKGYMSSVFLVMGFKVLAPLLAIYVTWPVLGLSAVIAGGPFLIGCLAQYLFESLLTKQESSCWPLITIIFEVYRFYQLSKAAHFVETLMFKMKGAKVTPDMLERNGALISLVVTFQILGMFCLWSLLTFLMRLFPSRPVAENY